LFHFHICIPSTKLNAYTEIRREGKVQAANLTKALFSTNYEGERLGRQAPPVLHDSESSGTDMT
jgi:hypothetical protein